MIEQRFRLTCDECEERGVGGRVVLERRSLTDVVALGKQVGWDVGVVRDLCPLHAGERA